MRKLFFTVSRNILYRITAIWLAACVWITVIAEKKIGYSKMDLDPKCFFEVAPRMQESAKQFVKDLGQSIVEKVVSATSTLKADKINAKVVKLIVILVSNDLAITFSDKNGIMVPVNRMRTMSKIICRSIDSLDKDDKYGGLDRKIVKATAKLLDSSGIKYSSDGKLAICAFVSEVCGILLQSAVCSNPDKTLTKEMIVSNGFTYETSKEGVCVNGSLIRLVHGIQTPFPASKLKKTKCIENHFENKVFDDKEDEIDVFKQIRANKDVTATAKRPQKSALKKEVSFASAPQNAPRPHTPDVCFWEDD